MEVKPDDSINDAKNAAKANPPTMKNDDKPPFYESMGWTKEQMDEMSLFIHSTMNKIHSHPETYGKVELLQDLENYQAPPTLKLYVAYLIGGFIERDIMAQQMAANIANVMMSQQVDAMKQMHRHTFPPKG